MILVYAMSTRKMFERTTFLCVYSLPLKVQCSEPQCSGMKGMNYVYQQRGEESTVIERRQQQLGRMADSLPPVTFSVFDL